MYVITRCGASYSDGSPCTHNARGEVHIQVSKEIAKITLNPSGVT